MSTFAVNPSSLQDMLKKVGNGTIQLPDFQREWVWDDYHIRSLIASIAQSFPVAVVMMLENGGSVRFEKRRIAGTKPKLDAVTPDILILDGQQRLTALFQSLISRNAVNTLDAKKKKVQRWYYLDMKQCIADTIDWEEAVISVPENRIVKGFRGETILDLSDSNKEYKQDLFPVSRIFDTDAWMWDYLEHWKWAPDKRALYQEFNKAVIKSFERYQVPIIILDKDTPKEAVCLIFEKVNQQGVQLTVFELLTASFAVDNFNLRDDWNRKYEEMKEKFRVLEELESTNFLRALTLLVTNANPETTISCTRRDILRLTSKDYDEWTKGVEKGFIKAARFLHKKKIFNARDLPYQTQLVPLAAILASLGDLGETKEVQEKIACWYWCGVLGEMYGAATDTRFANDVSEVTNWVKKTGREPRTIREANFQENRLPELRTRNGAAYKGIFALLMQNDGCRDFRTGEPIEVQKFFNDNIDIHHIFPKRWCEKENIDKDIYNSIINKTALSSRTNRMIGGKAPSEYLQNFEQHPQAELLLISETNSLDMDEILKSHLICPSALRADDFERFFKARKEKLLKAIADVMGKPIIRENEN